MIKVDYNNMLSHSIAEQGITRQEILTQLPKFEAALVGIKNNLGKGWLGWTELVHNQKEIVKNIKQTALDINKKFDTFVVLGIGGSALGPIAAFTALKHYYHNELAKEKRNTPKFYCIDNIDADRITQFLDVIDLEKTIFNVITKSGATSETMSQYLLIWDILSKKLSDKAAEHIIATTDAKKGNLIKLANKHNFKTFIIPDGVGGRFSQLSPVGLLPAAVLGLDIEKMLLGAEEMTKRCLNNDIWQNPALMTAALQYICMQKGKNISVMMPYSDGLRYVADWYCQLWGESLGKSIDRKGKTINCGQTPVKALGATDQHSQIQLYTEGPFDKVVTFINVEKLNNSLTIPHGCEEFADVNFLCGNTFNDLLEKEFLATRYALTKNKRSNYTITLSEINEYNFGGLLQLFMMQTAFCGEMLDIDAFNQPGVEEGKNATYALFGRKGYEIKLFELEAAAKPKKEYII